MERLIRRVINTRQHLKRTTMYDIQVIAGRTTINHHVQLETLPLINDLLAFRITKSQIVTDRAGDLVHGHTTGPEVTEGVITKAALADFKANRALTVSKMVVFSDDLKESIRRRGWHVTFAADGENRGVNEIRYDVFTAITNGTAGINNLVTPDWGNYIAYDVHGNLLPTAVVMSYIDGYIDNGHYNLKRAAEHLLSRSDVTVFKDRTRTRANPDEAATTVAEAISAIPYYNASSERSQHIEFCWSPSAEDFKRMINHVIKRKKHVALHSEWYMAIFELDLLGLRAAGAALFDNYYEEIERRRDEDEED